MFHTELEVVYEEKNMGLDNDRWKVEETMYEELFKKHQYGTQTTIGSIEHIKNPSIKKVLEYYKKYYVPNNMAICLSGDFNPDSVIRIIDDKFGSFERKEVPEYIPPVEDPITKSIEREVLGPQSENVRMGFRFGGELTPDADYLRVIDMILSNSVAGLIDLNLVQKQKVLSAGSYPDIMKDYSIHVLYGRPREGQTLKDVKNLLLSQIDLIKKGEFPDWLVEAVIKNMKLSEIRRLESNWSRAYSFVQSFINWMDYEYYINRLERYSKITRQDIIDFANRHYADNYVVVYKRTGEDKNVKKVIKPSITPVELNREEQSVFAAKVINTEAPAISPVFLDYSRDISQFSIKQGLPVYYMNNVENDIFRLYYILDMGNNHNNRLAYALRYLKFLGTSKYSPEQIKQEFYKTGCSFSVSTSYDQLWVSLSGLRKDFEKGIILLEELLGDAQPDDKALNNQVADILKQREDNKLSKWMILHRAMRNYATYGPQSPFTNILSEEELNNLKPAELVKLIKNITSYQHRVLYYGPHSRDELKTLLNNYHKLPGKYSIVPEPLKFEQLPTSENKVYITHYDMKQAEIYMISKGEQYNPNNVAIRRLFNEYYGGGMSSVIFTTLRESKALAYSTYAAYTSPDKPDKAHYVTSELLNDMPESDNLIELSKDAVIKQIETNRITKSSILFNYERAREMGRNHDIRKDMYQHVPQLEMQDVKDFHEKYFKGNKYTILIVTDTAKLDYDILRQYAEPHYLTLEEIFGY
jgi:predicted Zn-dependent peptidase